MPTPPKPVPNEALAGLPIHRRIRVLREAADLAAYELAKRAGISPSYLSLIESGEKIPSEDVAVKIANALHDDPELYRGWAHAGGREDHRKLSSLETYLRYVSSTAMTTARVVSDELEAGTPEEKVAEEDLVFDEEQGDIRYARFLSADAIGRPDDERGLASVSDPDALTMVEIPVLEEGADPGGNPLNSGSVVEIVHLDGRMLPPDKVERPFAYRPGSDALARVGKLIKADELVVLTSVVGNVGPQSVHAVRFRGGIVLSRVLFKGNALLLLPPAGSSDFDIVEVGGRADLARIIAGTVVLTVKSWAGGDGPRSDEMEPGPEMDLRDFPPVQASAPRRSLGILGRAVSSLRRGPTRRLRPYSSRGARIEGDFLVRDCEWKDKYGWRPVQRPEDLDFIHSKPGMKMRFNLIREGKVRCRLEMDAVEWRTALGSYGESPSWPKNGYITAITKMREGVYTEEFKDRWAPYVKRPADTA